MNDTILTTLTNGSAESLLKAANSTYQEATNGWWVIVILVAILFAIYYLTESFELLSVSTFLVSGFLLSYGDLIGIVLTTAAQMVLYSVLVITFGITLYLLFGGGTR